MGPTTDHLSAHKEDIMMKTVAVFLCLVVVALAAPSKGKPHDHKPHDHKLPGGPPKAPEPKVFGRAITPFIPFPHFEELALYQFNRFTLLPGSAFTVLDHGHCLRASFTDEMGGVCPMNQTICDEIAANVCPPEVANVTCVNPHRPANMNETNNQGHPQPEGELGNGYPYGGPLCHVKAMGMRFQPSTYSAIFSLRPSLQTCFFSVAPPPVVPQPTAGPAPTQAPLAVDPPCPFLEA